MQPDTAYTFFPGASNFQIYGGRFGPHVPHNGYEKLLQATASNALHHSGHIPDPPRCHPGTRVAAINAIMNWMEGNDEKTRDKGICWVTGAAGAGKTAIGRSVSERCEEERKPLASFFFYSQDPTRSHSRALVPTLCSQICDTIPGMRQSVANVIDNDSHILNKSLKIKFEALIIAPLLEIYRNRFHSAPFIVIDGLDECVDKASQQEILDTLLNIVRIARVPIRFLICSRPEIQISNFFNTSNSTANTFKIFLSDEYSPDRDIELFLRDRFRVIRELPIFEHLGIAGLWPSEEQIKTLVEKSSGQFIFAATVVKYVESSEHLPNERLKAVLDVQRSREDLPFAGLDALYRHLVMTTPNPPETINILAIPALYGVASITSIERILRLQPGRARLVLSNLASIVKVDDSDRVTFLHKSFVDFLFDRYRSDNLFVDQSETHARNILHLIKSFAERPTGSGFHELAGEYYFLLSKLLDYDIRETSSRRIIVKALIEFPMRSLCIQHFEQIKKSLQPQITVHYRYFPAGVRLFEGIFSLIMGFKHYHPNLEDALYNHLCAFCQCNLSLLNAADGLWNWYFNCSFTFIHLKRKVNINMAHPWPWGMEIIQGDSRSRFNQKFSKIVSRTFQSLLTKASRSRIIAKAAVFCLEFLCSNRRTKAEVNRHLRVNPIVHTKKKTYPLLWKRRRPSYKSFSNRPVLLKYKYKKPGNVISTYGKIMGLTDLWIPQIYSLSGGRLSNKHKPRDMEDVAFPPFDWNASETPTINQNWYQYLTHLKYFSYILGEAGPYDPLIEMCKTKSLAKMSMIFEKDNRRARRAITRYLERVGAEDDGQIEARPATVWKGRRHRD